MSRLWQGIYLDGRTAQRHPATVRLQPSGLEIAPERGQTLFWPYGEVRQTQGRYAGEQVRLERGGEIGEALIVPSAAFLVDLHQTAPQLTRHVHDPRRRRARVRLTLGAGVAVILITLALYLWGIPALAGLAAEHVPVAWEARLGQAVVEALAPAATQCTDPAGSQAIEGIVATLARPLTRSPYTFRVIVVDDKVVNAFATPGGRIVVLRGLLEHVRTPEELAGVLAHEMQHVLRRHPTRALLQHASTGLVLTALTGDVTGLATYGLESARTLGRLRYSREAEDEADLEGARMLVAAGIDPSGLAGFLESLKEGRGGPPAALRYLSTHPDPANRVARLRAGFPPRPSRPAVLPDGAAWQAIKGMCAARHRPD